MVRHDVAPAAAAAGDASPQQPRLARVERYTAFGLQREVLVARARELGERRVRLARGRGAGKALGLEKVARELESLLREQEGVCDGLGGEVEAGRAKFESLKTAMRGAVERGVEAGRRLSTVEERVLELEREGEEARDALEEARGEGRIVGDGLREAVREKEGLRARLRKAVEKGVETGRKLERERSLRKKLVARLVLVEREAVASELLAREREAVVAQMRERAVAVELARMGEVQRRDAVAAELRDEVRRMGAEVHKAEAVARQVADGARCDVAELKRERDEARLAAWTAGREHGEVKELLESELEGARGEARYARRAAKAGEAQVAEKDCKLEESASRLAESDFEALRLAERLRSSERVASGLKEAAVRIEAKAERKAAEVVALKQVADAGQSRIQVLQAELVAAADAAEELCVEKEALEIMLRKSEVEVKEMQEACVYDDDEVLIEEEEVVYYEEVDEEELERIPFAEAEATAGDFENDENLLDELTGRKAKTLSKQYVFSPNVDDFIPIGESAGSAVDDELDLEESASYSKLYWAPPGTKNAVLQKTIHKDSSASVQVLEVEAKRWVDGATLWFDVATALIPDANCARSPPPEGSDGFWDAIETAFLSAAGDDDVIASAPLVIVLRKAGILAREFDEADEDVSGFAFEAIQKITGLADMLHSIHPTLTANRFSVSVVLEGWPGAVPLGSHMAQSLLLPRVSRRSGKSRRYNRSGTTLTMR